MKTNIYIFSESFNGLSKIPTVIQKRQNIKLPNTRLFGRYKNSNTGGGGEWQTPKKSVQTTKSTQRRRIQGKLREIRILPRRNNLDGKRDNWVRKKAEKGRDKSYFTIKSTDIMSRIKINSRTIKDFSKYIHKLSKKTDRMRHWLRKKPEWSWTEREEEDFNELKKKVIEILCLAHFASDQDSIVWTDDSGTRLGMTVWRNQIDNTSEQKHPPAEIWMMPRTIQLEKWWNYSQ